MILRQTTMDATQMLDIVVEFKNLILKSLLQARDALKKAQLCTNLCIVSEILLTAKSSKILSAKCIQLFSK